MSGRNDHYRVTGVPEEQDAFQGAGTPEEDLDFLEMEDWTEDSWDYGTEYAQEQYSQEQHPQQYAQEYQQGDDYYPDNFAESYPEMNHGPDPEVPERRPRRRDSESRRTNGLDELLALLRERRRQRSADRKPKADRERRREHRTGAGRSGEDEKEALKRLLIRIAALAVIGFVLLHFVIGVFINHSNDMFPAVRDGDLCITYRLKKPAYEDIVAYKVGGERHFGRIVGLPGDVIEMGWSAGYTVNGTAPYETVFYDTTKVDGSTLEYPYTVGEKEIFVLNDLRDNGTDSRLYGAIPLSDTDGSLVLLWRHRSW